MKYFLAVATSVEENLLGVTFSSAGEICLVPTHVSVSTDNVLMLKLASTLDGRILMPGADASLRKFKPETHSQTRLLAILSSRPAKRARKIILIIARQLVSSLCQNTLR